MKVSLVIMAAGLGSRYGGSKQIDGIGPHNEILMEYSIYDALQAGFNKIVFIIKPDMEELMDRLLDQNFVPVVDDRDMFAGIVTRRSVMAYLMDNRGALRGTDAAPEGQLSVG